MFITRENDKETKVELDRVEIALLYCLFRGMSPQEAIKSTEAFLSAQSSRSA